MPITDCLARIEVRDTEVRGWCHLDRSAAGGEGPLAGLTLGVKDVIDVAGMPTSYGSPIFADHIATSDAEAVARLRAAGAAVLGKTVTAEFATYHPGPTVNPRKAGHTPGGSSSGSAAVVADGQADMALGTQTAGSMIRPASFCGVPGFKPSLGRYPLDGVLDTSPNLDTLGLFARNLDIMIAADAVLSGESELPPIQPSLDIGLCRSPAWGEADVEMQSAIFAFAERLRTAGHRVIERELPAPCDALAQAQALIHRREAWMTLGHIRRDHPKEVSDTFRDMIDQGAAEDEADYQAALGTQEACKALLWAIFEGLDMLLVPGATGAAPEGLGATGNPVFQRIWTALGIPCLGLPAAWRTDGLPLGIQLVGPPGADRRLLLQARMILAQTALKQELGMEPTVRMPFTPAMEAAYAKARSKLDPVRLKQLLFDITNIHSPTGATRDVAEFLAGRMAHIGLKPALDPMSEISANVLGERRGAGDGATLLLYAPIDTHLEGDSSDFPWAGPEQFVDLKPEAKTVGDWVYGLGSSNPKGMVASLMEVATALIEADVPLLGNLNVGFADGGMPVTIYSRNNAGMSSGVHHLLNRGMAPDFAVIMKPWNWVYHEEPGMGWFKIQVKGTLGYAGVPRGTPGFRSSVVPAATVILELEKWLIDYAERNRSGDVYPHGWIAGVRGGWPERPAFPSAVTEIFFDVRINPRTSPGEVKSQFEFFMLDLARRFPDIDCDWEMYGSAPGGTTDPANWIIQSARRGWEHIEGKAYSTPDPLGGQTDGAALRRLGVPTARIGWPWPAEGSPEPIAEGLGGMGATYIPDLMPCVEKILYACIDTLMRPRRDLGL